MNVTIFGAGAFGRAIHQVLTENGHKATFFDPFVYPEVAISDALQGAEVVVLAMPSGSVPQILRQIPNNLPLIVATKGLLSAQVFEGFDFSIVSGAGYASDIMEHTDTVLTATSKLAPRLLETPYLKFELTSDVDGVLLCGALKNVFAIGAGMLGLQPGTAELAQYLASVSTELAEILAANGADASTAALSCGIRDVELTCSPRSRNYQFGAGLIDNTDATVEGISTLKSLRENAIKIPASATIITNLIKESEKWV